MSKNEEIERIKKKLRDAQSRDDAKAIYHKRFVASFDEYRSRREEKEVAAEERRRELITSARRRRNKGGR